MNSVELKRIEQFKNKHYDKKCYMKSRTAARFKITIQATGLFEHIKVKCCNCGTKKDVTDYNSV